MNTQQTAKYFNDLKYCVISEKLPQAWNEIKSQSFEQAYKELSKGVETHLILTNTMFCIDIDLKVIDEPDNIKEADYEDFTWKCKEAFLPFDNFVIEKTKSGGYHLYFKAPDLETKNSVGKNLAKRNNKPFIEYLKQKVTCYPTKNYTFVQGDLACIPTLTSSQFYDLIDICEGMTDEPKEVISVQYSNTYTHTYNEQHDDSTIFDFCVSIIEKKHSYVSGNTNEYLLALISYCNIKGVGKDWLIQECQSRYVTKNVTKSTIKSKINSIYNKYSGKHNSEPYTAPKERKEYNTNYTKPKQKTTINIKTATEAKAEEVESEKKEKSISKIELSIKNTIRFLNEINLSVCKYTNVFYKDGTEIKKADVKSIYLLCRQKFSIGKDDFNAILESTNIKIIDKIADLVEKLKSTQNYNGTIQSYFNTLVLKNKEHNVMLQNIFKKWLVGIWYCLLGEGIKAKNDIFLVLTGTNNLGKSYFFKDIFECVNLEFANLENQDEANIADIKRFVSQKPIVFFDDFKKDLLKKDDFLKSILSNSTLSYVQKYSETAGNMKRIASFCGTSNYENIIHNAEFNRRIVPISIIGRDREAHDKIDKFKLFAESYNLFASGYDHELSAEEVEFVKALSKEHKETTFELSMVLERIMPANFGDEGSVLMTATQIKDYLNVDLAKNVTHLGRVLTDGGFQRVKDKVIDGKRVSTCFCVFLNT